MQQKLFAGASMVFLIWTGLGWRAAHAQSADSRANVQPSFRPVNVQGAQMPAVTLAVTESPAQPAAAVPVARERNPDSAWRLTPAQRAELREQVRRSSAQRSGH